GRRDHGPALCLSPAAEFDRNRPDAGRQGPPYTGAMNATESARPDGLARLDWPAILSALDQGGYAVLPALLDAAECAALVRAYEDNARFRSRIVMARHGFGRGEYKYFGYPLPDIVGRLREP